MEDFADAAGDLGRRTGCIADVDEGDGESAVLLFEALPERLFVAAVGFAHLALHAVAVDGVMEAALGHADEDL